MGVLLRVVEKGSFSAASRALHMPEQKSGPHVGLEVADFSADRRELRFTSFTPRVARFP
jgi:hypothetical protein